MYGKFLRLCTLVKVVSSCSFASALHVSVMGRPSRRRLVVSPFFTTRRRCWELIACATTQLARLTWTRITNKHFRPQNRDISHNNILESMRLCDFDRYGEFTYLVYVYRCWWRSHSLKMLPVLVWICFWAIFTQKFPYYETENTQRAVGLIGLTQQTSQTDVSPS